MCRSTTLPWPDYNFSFFTKSVIFLMSVLSSFSDGDPEHPDRWWWRVSGDGDSNIHGIPSPLHLSHSSNQQLQSRRVRAFKVRHGDSKGVFARTNSIPVSVYVWKPFCPSDDPSLLTQCKVDGDGIGDGVGMCKQALTRCWQTRLKALPSLVLRMWLIISSKADECTVLLIFYFVDK